MPLYVAHFYSLGRCTILCAWDTLDLTSSACVCRSPPRRHVNFGRGGLGDSGNSCLSAQRKERLNRNGSPVGPARRLVCEAAVCSFPLELHISAPVYFGSLSRSVKVSQCFCCTLWLTDETAGSPKESSSWLWCFCLDKKNLGVHSSKVKTFS